MKKKELSKLVAELRADNQQMRETMVVLNETIKQLQLTIAELLSRGDQQGPAKNSGNSSLPPSSDIVPRTKSLRKPSGKKNGGQPGHEGSTLKFSTSPDLIEDIVPEACVACGADLSARPGTLAACREVIDIPPVRSVITRYHVFQKVCTCGVCTQSLFPEGVNAPVSYGQGVESLVAYLSVRQLIPYGRLVEILRDNYGLDLSQGTIANILKRFTAKASTGHQQIKQNLLASVVVGSDETGGKIDGKKAWFHMWQDRLNTYIICSDNRGSKTIDREFPNGFPAATLVSDCWAAQLKTAARGHQICLAHLLRELNYFQEAFSSDWSKELSVLFTRAIELDNKGPLGKKQAQKLNRQLDKLLAQQLAGQPDKIIAFQRRLVKNREAVFRFLQHPDIPPTNNASERAIRNITVKRKISGQFKSQWGADTYAVIRSVIDTAIKRNLNVMEQINNIANLNFV